MDIPDTIKDFKNPKWVTVIVDADTNRSAILGTRDPWMDMAYQLEGLALTCQMCIRNGIPPEKVYGEIKNYFMKIEAAGGYKITDKGKIV